MGWPIILFLIAERLVTWGATPLPMSPLPSEQGPVGIISACGSLVVVALPYRPDGGR
ncbi:hypothetical protein ACNKHU_25730 [Shigella flexneri]